MSINRLERTGKRPSLLSKWSRKFGDGSCDGNDPRCRQLDLDFYLYCPRCRKILAVFEESNKGLSEKCSVMTQQIAKAVGCPAYLFHTPDGENSETILLKLVSKPDVPHSFTFIQLENWVMGSIYDRHEAKCPKPSLRGRYRWNPALRRSEIG